MVHACSGLLLQYGRTDIDGAEASYRAAIEADPGCAPAHAELGLLLQHEQKDLGGAEAAYCAAIETDPGYATALLQDKR